MLEGFRAARQKVELFWFSCYSIDTFWCHLAGPEHLKSVPHMLFHCECVFLMLGCKINWYAENFC